MTLIISFCLVLLLIATINLCLVRRQYHKCRHLEWEIEFARCIRRWQETSLKQAEYLCWKSGKIEVISVTRELGGEIRLGVWVVERSGGALSGSPLEPLTIGLTHPDYTIARSMRPGQMVGFKLRPGYNVVGATRSVGERLEIIPRPELAPVFRARSFQS